VHLGGTTVPNGRYARRKTDAAGLHFPLQLVIMIATTSAAAAVTIWGSQYGLRSDVRDIRTRMEMAAELAVVQTKLQEERAAALKAAIDAVQRDQRMTQFEVQGLKESLLKMQQGR
jgi:hypothetical protein